MMNRDEAKAFIQRLADRHAERKKDHPEWYREFIELIRIIAKEIYSQDAHFVYELIQNAEDNNYPPDRPDRVLEFILEPGRIVIRNNEVGFTAANVEALCSVARSTKVDKTLGYIGEKGIGFKSVFKISPAPQVHSNRFHFAFDDREMIVPRWCEWPEGIPSDEAMTTIVLPLREGNGDDLKPSLRRDFIELPGETLLFLTRLNRIRIDERIGGTCREIARRGGRHGLVVIEDGETERRWRVHRRKIDVPRDVSEPKREGVRSRELVIAFQADSRGFCLRPADATVFAFLPTNLRPGLPFLIQGDFLTTANRESIHVDSAWNRWLRDELAPCYLEAVRAGVREDESFRISFLQTLPLPDEVSSSFFKPVAERLVEAIVREQVFPGESGRIRTLDELRRGDEMLRRLFPSACLADLLGDDVEYIDARFSIPEAVEEFLPIGDVGDELSDLLSDPEWLARQDDNWFIDLYGYLNDHPDLVHDDDLRALPVVRLEGGQVARADGDTIYLPPSEERVAESYGLKRFEFRIVSHAIVRRVPGARSDEEKRHNRRTQAARAFLLDHLDVRHHRPLEIALNQILPYLEGKEYGSVDQLEADFGLVRYVKEHWPQIRKELADEEAGHDLASFSSALGCLPLPVVGERKAREVRPAVQVYLPPGLGGDRNLQRLFRDVPDVWFVDKDRLLGWDRARRSEERKLEEWQVFLADIGAASGFRLITKAPVHFGMPSVSVPDEMIDDMKVVRVENYLEIEHLAAFFEHLEEEPDPVRRKKRGRLLLELLDRQWSILETLAEADRPDGRDWWLSTYLCRLKRQFGARTEPLEYPCEFVLVLRGASWVPVQGDDTPRRPGEVWIDDDHSGLGFADGRRLEADVKNQGLIEALGLRTRPTIDDLLVVLNDRVNRGETDPAAYRTLYSLLDHVWDRDPSDRDQTGDRDSSAQGPVVAFRESRLIYVPGRPCLPFAPTDEVIWEADGRGDRGLPAIGRAYPTLRDFFLDLGVAERATPRLALEILRRVAEDIETRGDGPDAADRLRIGEAYQSLEATARDVMSDDLRDLLTDLKLLGVDNVLHRREELIAPDDALLHEHFHRAGLGPFLWLPETAGDTEMLAGDLASLLDLRRISQAGRRIDPVTAEPDEGCEEVRTRFDAIRRYLLGFIRKVAPTRHETLERNGQAAVLTRGTLRFCREIKIDYIYGGQTIVAPRETSLALDTREIFFRVDRIDRILDLGTDLEETLGVDGLAEAFFTLMSLPPEQRRQHAERQKYIIPEPEPPHPSVPEHEDGPTMIAEGRPGVRPAIGRNGKGPEDPPTGGPSGGVDQGDDRNESQQIQPLPPPPIAPDIPTTEPPSQEPEQAGQPSRPRGPRSERPAPHDGEPFSGPTRYRPPRAANDRLRRRLGEKLQRREASEYLEGPPADQEPGSALVENGPLPTHIKTILRAVNLEYRFLHFARDDFRIFSPNYPSRITLVADDEQLSIEVAVDYARGMLHGDELAEFIELQAWPYGAILSLTVTDSPDRFHLRAQLMDEPKSPGSVSYFDIDDNGEPVVKTSHPDAFEVAIDENVYRQERRWENRRAYDALVARNGEGVLTAVFKLLEASQGALSAAEIHRRLMAAGRPCSYFSVLGVLYGYKCFEAAHDHRWRIAAGEQEHLREGYQRLLGPTDPQRPSDGGSRPPTEGLIADADFRRLESELRRLTRPARTRWMEAIDLLIQELLRIKVEVEVAESQDEPDGTLA